MVKEIWDESKGKFVKIAEGGSGSGNFGHSGRPGSIGGSGGNDSPAEQGARGAKSENAKRAEYTSHAYGGSWNGQDLTGVKTSAYGLDVRWGKDGINGSAHFSNSEIQEINKATPKMGDTHTLRLENGTNYTVERLNNDQHGIRSLENNDFRAIVSFPSDKEQNSVGSLFQRFKPLK